MRCGYSALAMKGFPCVKNGEFGLYMKVYVPDPFDVAVVGTC